MYHAEFLPAVEMSKPKCILGSRKNALKFEFVEVNILDDNV
jgi:hypothetical protein